MDYKEYAIIFKVMLRGNCHPDVFFKKKEDNNKLNGLEKEME